MIDINFVSPTGGLVKSVNGKTGNVVLTALDIKGVATEDYVSAKIAEAQLAEGGEVDLTAYATKDYVNQQIDAIPETDLSNYYTKTQTDNAISTAVGNVKVDLTGYATETYVAEEIAKAKLEGEDVDLSAYATKEYVDKAIEGIEIPEADVDLTNYYTKGEVDLLIPDVSGYTTMSAVEGKGYQTAEQVNALIADALADIEIGGNAPSAEGVEF